MTARIWMPLPDHDFDVTEVAVPWKLATDAGHEVVFATEAGGAAPACDPLLLTGVLFGALGAAEEPAALYRELEAAPSFRAPVSWRTLDPLSFDALVLPGGHAPGMKQYLGSAELQEKVAAFFATGRPVGAICHGVLVAARAGALRGRRTTCLPKYMERSAYLLTFWRRGRYYRTYPAYVEDEVRAALDAPDSFVRGPRVLTRRGTATDDTGAFVVEDGPYVSARWPGDAYLFARTLLSRLPG
ncbi:MAG TPA: type 1 glutamine amidotransferase domain-containing protein [Kofleriaceae bacterium]|nr:type 1 glutamine amidotransferase domain-containing protein [Kofleriaceae bacterium]